MKTKFSTKRMVAIFAALLCLMPMMAQPIQVNIVGKNAHITQTSTLFVGEVIHNGQQSFYYLYSDDITNSSNVLGAVRDCLQDFKGGIYSILVSNDKYIGEGTGITACSISAYESIMNADWKDAYKAGQACFPNTVVAASSSANLFDTDADFAEKCSRLLSDNGIDLVDGEGDPLAVSGVLGVLSSTNKDDVTYQEINGQLVKLINRTIDYYDESVTVIYTKVELQPLSLADNADNSTAISANNGLVYDVTLGRTLQAGGWNTFCVPFEISSSQITSVFGDGTKVRELGSSDFNSTTKVLTLNFAETTSIDAGKPYLIWIGNENAVTNPTFNGVTIDDETSTKTTTYADFVPVMNPTELTANDKSVLFVTGGDKLTYPNTTGNINGFRAYFQLKGDASANAQSFIMSFDDETTEISEMRNEKGEMRNVNEEMRNDAAGCYDLQGRRIETSKFKAQSSKLKKGIYIVKGKKVVIK